jgi:ATP-dependent helicase IRC3
MPVFCVDLAHVHELANAFRAAGIDARAVSSKTKPAERRKLVEDFRAGVFPVLVNCEIFTEGTDIPEVCRCQGLI